MGTAIKHTVPDRVKPSFVIFDIRALWRSGLSVRVPGCQKLHSMLYSCAHMTTVGVKGLSRRLKLSVLSVGSRRSSLSEFQAVGPATANAQCPYQLRLCRGTAKQETDLANSIAPGARMRQLFLQSKQMQICNNPADLKCNHFFHGVPACIDSIGWLTAQHVNVMLRATELITCSVVVQHQLIERVTLKADWCDSLSADNTN